MAAAAEPRSKRLLVVRECTRSGVERGGVRVHLRREHRDIWDSASQSWSLLKVLTSGGQKQQANTLSFTHPPFRLQLSLKTKVLKSTSASQPLGFALTPVYYSVFALPRFTDTKVSSRAALSAQSGSDVREFRETEWRFASQEETKPQADLTEFLTLNMYTRPLTHLSGLWNCPNLI